jgi:hypothetical protein
MEVLFYSSIDAAAQAPTVNGRAISAGSVTKTSNDVTLTISKDGIDPNVTKNLDLGTLGIYAYTTQGLTLVTGSKTNADGTVSAPIRQSGVYILAAAFTTDLSGAYAYPVPYKPSAGHTVITFKNLALDSTIKIYTIMGELVKQLDNGSTSDKVTWDVKNRDGDNVASGVYIYQIKNAYSEKRGKVVIIR